MSRLIGAALRSATSEAAGLSLLIAIAVAIGIIAAAPQGGSRWTTRGTGLATAVPTFLASMAVHHAAGKPALQALAGVVMLLSGLAAAFMWQFAPGYSAVAAVSWLLAGKRRAACLSTTPPVTEQLCKAAFAAGVVHTALAPLCLQGRLDVFEACCAVLTAALASGFTSNAFCAALAEMLLPPAIHQHLRDNHRVHSETLLPNNWDRETLFKRSVAAVVLISLFLLGNRTPMVEALQAWLAGNTEPAAGGPAPAPGI